MNRIAMRNPTLTVVAILALALAGCGGGGGGAKNNGGGDGVLITAATGGTVTNGKASVGIPANALATDTRIAVNAASGTLPAPPTNMQILGGTAFDLGPTGLTFATGSPATLTIKYNVASLPPGVPESSIKIYTLVSGAWVLVSGSSVDTFSHAVTLPIAHFSVYALICPAFVGEGPIYNVVDLGLLPGDAGATPNGISSDGKVVGLSATAAGDLHAFLWDNGQLTNLGHREGDIWGQANDVNSSGVAVGISFPDSSNAFPVKFDHGVVTQLETQFGLVGGNATAINDPGDYIVSRAIFQKGKLTPFVGFVPSGESGALNNAGAVAGTADPDAAIWSNGSLQDVGILPGYDYSKGIALSDSGILVGTAAVAGEDLPVGFVYQGGTMTKIAPLTGDNIALPHGVNDSGTVVGTSSNGFITVRAFIYKNGVTQQLDSLISRATGWTIIHAYGINNKGQIIGLGVNGGAQHAILLNPKS